jgi:hypothetical protein
MKKLLITIILFFLVAGSVFAQMQAEISRDAKNGSKVIKGILTRHDLESDTAFGWYAENLKSYHPQPTAVAALRKNPNIEFIVFMGTWCDDSHFIVPKFFSLLDSSGISADKVSMFGCDREKKTLRHFSEAMNVTNVPTIIVMNQGKEVGRVIEYGKTGYWDKELGEIIDSIPHG